MNSQTLSATRWLPLFIDGENSVEETLDRELIEKCKKRDPLALDSLFRSYEKRVIALVYRMIGNREEAEDVAQDIFVNVFKSLSNFRSEAQLTTWIYRITINYCLNYRRKWFLRRKKHAYSLDEPAGLESGLPRKEVAGRFPNPVKTVLQKELKDALQRGLLSLSLRLRSIIILRDIEGLSYEEIGETLDISPGTVKSRLNRARSALRKKMIPYLKA